MYFREDGITKQLFRRSDGLPEEYIRSEGVWKVTTDAIDAFYEGTDTHIITEEEAAKNLEFFKK